MMQSRLLFEAARLQIEETDRRSRRLGPQLAALRDRDQEPIVVRVATSEDRVDLDRIASGRHSADAAIRRGASVRYAACLGGQTVSECEQNTQQSPSLGFNVSPHPVQR